MTAVLLQINLRERELDLPVGWGRNRCEAVHIVCVARVATACGPTALLRVGHAVDTAPLVIVQRAVCLSQHTGDWADAVASDLHLDVLNEVPSKSLSSAESPPGQGHRIQWQCRAAKTHPAVDAALAALAALQCSESKRSGVQ